MSTVIIREALIDDLPHCLPLMSQLGYAQSAEILKRRFELFLTQADYGIRLAEFKEQVIGLIAWSKSHLFVSETTRIHIEALIVDKDYRGQQVGKKLVLALEVFARLFSPCIIDLTSGLKRAKDGSHDFYKTLGYQNEGYMAKLYLRKTV